MPPKAIRKPGLRSSGPAPAIETPSSGTTVVDENMNTTNGDVINGSSTHDMYQCDADVRPKANTDNLAGFDTQATIRSDMSRLSQSLEAQHLTAGQVSSTPRSQTMEPPDVSVLGEGVRDLIALMSELSKLGFEQSDIPTVRCVVCGDQSAGKSSVIEAISGITVPRESGTCTRCPIFIELESSAEPAAEWHAKVCLRQGYQYIPNGREAAKQKFHSWSPRVPVEEVDFARTHSLAELKELISRAQLAVLNPGQHYARYVPGSTNEITSTSRQTEFSPNVVCIYITAPNLPNLSFYDLPGIIIGRGDRAKDQLKKFVETLVKEYITDPYTLVLLSSSLEIDWDVASHAATLVTKTKATGRCLGVLTKPDRIDTDDRYNSVQKALEGELDALGHGYFVVKQPSQNELNEKISHIDARKREAEFFSGEAESSSGNRWPVNRFAVHQHRLGTKNLQTALSEKLAALASQSLPTIQGQLAERLHNYEVELAEIPKPLTRDAISNVTNALYDFTNRVRKELSRKGTNNEWKITWDHLQREFHKKIESFKPRLNLHGDLDEQSLSGPETVDLCSDDENGPPTREDTPVTPSKRKREGTIGPNNSFKNPHGTEHGSPTKKARSSAHPNARLFYLDETAGELYRLSSTKIPGHPDPKAVEELMRQGLQLDQWKKVTDSFLADMGSMVSQRIVQILEDSLGKWRTTEFFHVSLRVVQDAISEYLNEQCVVIAPALLNDQACGPYLFGNPYFADIRSKAETVFRAARFEKRKGLYFRKLDEQIGKPSQSKWRDEQAKKEPARSIIEKEPYEEVLAAFAQMRAHYTLASVQFREAICMRIESRLFAGLRETLLAKLNDGLGIVDDDVHRRCVQLLADNPEREARRQELELKKADLLKGQQILVDHFRKYSVNDDMSGNGGGDSGNADEDQDMPDEL